MDHQLLTKLQELIQQGEKLVPEGGLEFSGYNAKMQSQYLLWRKNGLDALTKVGEKAAVLREKVAKDENGAYFYQNSAQLILETLKSALPIVEADVKKNAPKAAPAPPPPAPKPEPPKPEPPKPEPPKPEPPPAAAPKPEPKPEPAPVKPAPAPKPEPPKTETPKPAPAPAAPAASQKEVLIISSSETELQTQLTSFLKEISIEPVVFKRGTAPDAIISFVDQHPGVRYAYYLFNAEDINIAMFEMGFLMGRVGNHKVVCVHMKEDAPPKGLPGVSYKEIVVKLEEISFGLIKDLKAAGYSVSI